MMRRCAALFTAVTIGGALCAPDRTDAQPVTGVGIRLQAPKATYEQVSDGPVLVGPQKALEFDWAVHNISGHSLEIESPRVAFLLRVSGSGHVIPVRTEWAAEMKLNGNRDRPSGTLPMGPATLPDSTFLVVRGSTRRLDGSAFAPGRYVLEVDATKFRPVVSGPERIVPLIDALYPIKLLVLDLDTPARRRQFHSIEGNYYRDIDSDRALEHFVALAALPGASWMDSIPLAYFYGRLGRHREACDVFRRILPSIIRSLDTPTGRQIFKDNGNLRRAATSCAAAGDLTLASRLLRLEGRTPIYEIPAEIERLKKSAPKPR
jgi:hypothetical protein